MPEVHAKLSASASARWLHCPPSVALSEQFPDTRSQFAAEGTLAHGLAELALQLHFVRGFGKKTYEKQREALIVSSTWEGEPLYQHEMDGHVETYTDYIKKVATSYPSEPYVCIEKRVNYGKWAPEGFGTADCVIIHGENMHIIDLKYGKGVPVDAELNSQLMLYALGAYDTYRVLYNIKQVHLTIVQPRLNNISEWSISLEDLLAWGDTVKPIAEQASKGEGEFKAGDWCKFCRARAVCRARAEYSVQLAGFSKIPPDTLTNDEIGEYLEKGKHVASWLSDLQEYALSQCLNGNDVKGWKAVEGTSRRAWTNADEAFKAIIDSGVDEAMLYERKPLSLAQVEKLVGKKDFNEQFGQFVHKPPGKPTLVVESDKRDAISNVARASDVFEKVEEKVEHVDTLGYWVPM